MRINLTKKDLVNLVYMQIGFSKQVSEHLIDDFFSLIISNLQNEKKIKLSNFGTFSVRQKKTRIGRNPKTKEKKTISERNVILFKPSKELKKIMNTTFEFTMDRHIRTTILMQLWLGLVHLIIMIMETCFVLFEIHGRG